ncbi:MAG: hypothetical protein AAF591_23395 [Verrucomicrobiota bacterium]
MKLLTPLLCLFLLGCEKRVADPGLEWMRDWSLSEDGERHFFDEETIPTSLLGDLAPREKWRVKRFGDNRTDFLFFAPLGDGETGLVMQVRMKALNTPDVFVGGTEGFRGRPFNRSVFESYGNPVDRVKYRRFRESLIEQSRRSLTNPR